jgi:hypothetical protein
MIEVIVMTIVTPHPHDIPLGHLVNLNEFLIEFLLLLLLVVPGVDLREPEVLDLVLAHEPVLHSALDVVDLELLTTLRHQLVLVQARVVPDRMLLTLMEVVQRERTLVRRTYRHACLPIRHLKCLLLVV